VAGVLEMSLVEMMVIQVGMFKAFYVLDVIERHLGLDRGKKQ
jgi:hypothetical protein